MGINDRNDDDGFNDFLDEVLLSDGLDGPAKGITKQVIERGMGSLSDRQKFVFKRDVLDEYTVDGCDRCTAPVPWSEMFATNDNGGLCNYCWHQSEKLEDE